MSKEDILDDGYSTEDTIAFIRQYLPQELKDKFSDDEMYYFLDLLDEYYLNSGILDEETDEDGLVEVDLEEVTKFIIKEAKKDDMGVYDPEEIFLIAQGEMEYLDSLDD
ncbi:MAG: hypothetical protein PHQ88_07380 [Bacteroides sp.]|nr:hypothetical protein [Bacteroides sp.]MDD2645946.1 hypothetical protein [Bacteroides sp.]MDD4055209.1 hypothetical protein [Bacteroides sp.]MDD4720660.1 hypothetical protein [Bacteroides sp.]NLI63854.1 hypothetical protein [Bacteroidales bacterium]